VWKSDQLNRLQGDVAAAALAVRKPLRHEFTPHVTLANPASKQAVDGYVRCLQEKIGEYDFTCTGYSLLRLDEQAREWKSVHEYRFTL
jgi:2'-5' RNA ligase